MGFIEHLIHREIERIFRGSKLRLVRPHGRLLTLELMARGRKTWQRCVVPRHPGMHVKVWRMMRVRWDLMSRRRGWRRRGWLESRVRLMWVVRRVRLAERPSEMRGAGGGSLSLNGRVQPGWEVIGVARLGTRVILSRVRVARGWASTESGSWMVAGSLRTNIRKNGEGENSNLKRLLREQFNI